MTNPRFTFFSLTAAAVLVVIASQSGTATAQTGSATGAATMAAGTMASGTMAATDAGAATAAPTSSIVLTAVATMAPNSDGSLPQLHIYNYTTYIANDTISNFEKLYHVKVTYDTYDTSDVMLTKIQAGNPGYDIIVPPDYDIPILAHANLLQKLDITKLPNFTKYASQRFQNPGYDPNNQYSVPYQWGTLGIGYNPAVLKNPTSWADLFNPALKGRVELLNSPRETIAIMLQFLGKDANSTNQADLDVVKAFLIKNKAVISRFHDSDGQFDLAKGQADGIMDWSGDMFQVIGDPANAKANLQYIIPKEGTVLWTDNMTIPAGAKNYDLALKFINYIYDPQVGASISNYTGYGSPNQGAIDQNMIDPAAIANPQIYPPASVNAKLVILKDIGDAQALYDQEWADIKAAISQ